jgi:hypothetical protein
MASLPQPPHPLLSHSTFSVQKTPTHFFLSDSEVWWRSTEYRADLDFVCMLVVSCLSNLSGDARGREVGVGIGERFVRVTDGYYNREVSPSTVQYTTVQYSTIQCSTVQCSVG